MIRMSRMRRLLATGVAVLILGAGMIGVAQAQSAFGSTFDHFTTGWPLENSHRNAACADCHVGGVFQGTPRECAACHSRAGLVKATGTPVNHISTTQDCAACHRETAWSFVARVDHTQVMGSCASCHNGRKASGKSPGHPPSGDQCEACHQSNAWLPAGFDHDTVTGNCASCHNGQTATGKPLGHVPSGNSCEDCHSSNGWTPAVFDHGGVAPGTCSNCHNGVMATGKPNGHIITLGQCDACHTTVAWLPATFNHDNITGSCSSCHNGTTATGKPSGHFITARDCNECHSSDFWSPLTFVHASPGYPGDHRAALQCADCHGGNSEAVTWSTPAYAPDCAGCHAGDFRPGEHRKTQSPATNYTASELRDCTGACHVYADSTLTLISDRKNGPEHRVNAGGF